jgi:hypothetical protein
MMIQGHENSVHHNGKGYEQFTKWIKDYECDDFFEQIPRKSAVPDTEYVNEAEASFNYLLLEQSSGILLFFNVTYSP